jgi:putative heme-binding domain-containing protein
VSDRVPFAWRQTSFLLVLCTSVAVAHEPGTVPQWIWSSAWTGPARHALLRRDFTLNKQAVRAELSLLADDRALVYLDGERIAESMSSKSWSRVSLPKMAAGMHRLAVHVENRTGPAGVCLRLRLFDETGRASELASDPRWRAEEFESPPATDAWRTAPIIENAKFAHSFGLVGVPPWHEPQGDAGDYYQWQKALGAKSAVDGAQIRSLPGFKVELVRSARPGESSWVSMAFLPNGDLLLGCEGRDKRNGLLRLHAKSGRINADSRSSVAEGTIHEARGIALRGAYLYVNANNDKTLVRLSDADNDGVYEKVDRLKVSPGDVGHGRNQLAWRGRRLYSILGNDVRLPEGVTLADSRFRAMANDRLTPCRWDRFLFDYQATLPAGHLISTDVEGKDWNLMAAGMRNPFGVDDHMGGDLFTFDADNEGDLGTPWYRPNRVLQLVPGADFGWRQGTAMRQGWHPESIPAVLDVGKASPTAVRFGYSSNFPEPYRSALFILDWSYGRIYAIHLLPGGAGFTAHAEVVVDGRPLNVTDLAFGKDGAMYFVTGGRGTQSGLYRVVASSDSNGLLASEPTPTTDRASLSIRRGLESDPGRTPLDLAWKHLGSDDPILRHAARAALEAQPPASWLPRLLGEENARIAAVALLAIARTGNAEQQRHVFDQLQTVSWEKSDPETLLIALRAVYVSLARHGKPDSERLAAVQRKVAALYPTPYAPVNEFACELLVYLEDPQVVAKTIPLLTAAPTQEEALLWLFQLRHAKVGWTPALRAAYWKALQNADAFVGGRELPVALFSIAAEFRDGLTPAELASLGDVGGKNSVPVSLKPNRPKVREWRVEDLTATSTRKPDFKRGREVYEQALCIHCHRYDGGGKPIGPDLDAVGRRMGRRDLLETILAPSKFIDAKFAQTAFEMRDGRTVTGRVVGGDDASLLIATNPASPFDTTRIRLADVAKRSTSKVSPMPAQLLDGFTADEIFDLLAYLESR